MVTMMEPLTAANTTPAPAPSAGMALPLLPEARTLVVTGRGELFFRHHRHPDPNAPTVLLLHGWTASADLQFFAAYPALAARCSFIGIDHRGHGRGMRPSVPFTLEDCADDAAALVRALGVERVIPVGYSMGGPISLLLTRAHPDLVQAIIVQATALTFAESGLDRLRWRTIRLVGPLLRSWAYPRSVRAVLRRLLGEDHDFREYSGWIAGEINRNEALAIVQAGKALSLYDARPWASSLGKPAGSLITTNDHLVKPRHQRALARALGATVEEIDADHLAALVNPTAYIAATLRLLDAVTA